MIHNNVKKLRESRGITQMELAKRIGVGNDYLNKIENMKKPLTSTMMAKRIAEVLEVTWNDIFLPFDCSNRPKEGEHENKAE